MQCMAGDSNLGSGGGIEDGLKQKTQNSSIKRAGSKQIKNAKRSTQFQGGGREEKDCVLASDGLKEVSQALSSFSFVILKCFIHICGIKKKKKFSSDLILVYSYHNE